ncbi:MAG TPA: sn-glycerol-3-phosphate ABC transporter ATP-binding protein UgpC [Streptosporangiaceae bacterium]|nr:sn-glycerol-3-phosphate ABC transporter ATP-binding protein UgpC [Streptosporangiaceae bacterium]
MAQVKYVSASRVFAKDAPPAVDALDLDIDDGEFMVLVGPSGSGKTTALRMLAGLEPLDGGRVEIGERDVTFAPPKDRDIAMVFQNYALYPQKTVAENMGFALKMQGVPKDDRARRVREAARLLDLDDNLLGRKPKQLSGGQRQRVAMGRAIVREPKVFLMDEPLSNLDAKLRVQTRAQIAELQRRLGVTTVYVTHDQVEAMTMGHRVAVLNGGKLQQCATPRELYDDPVNQFVAGFIGSPAMNLQTVPLVEGGVHIAGTTLPLPLLVRTAALESGLRELVLGIRPEHLHLADGAGELPGEVLLVEELGADALLHVRLAGGGQAMVARTEGRRPPARGQHVTFHVQPDDVFAFHPSTGDRLAA